jgi:hypothetical protein
MAGDFEIDITPSVTTYELYQIASYTHWFSIGEFVDNSITSAMQNWEALVATYGADYRLNVRIELDKDAGELRIIDNAAGIERGDIERSLRAGEPPLDRSWLSVHGVGMKMSAFWWGRRLSIDTQPLGDSAGYNVSVDLDEIKLTRSALMQVHPQQKTEISGTSVTISKISTDRWPRGTGLGKLKSLLSSMYRFYLNDRERPVSIYFNDKLLQFSALTILEAPYWPSTEGPQDDEVIRWEREFEFETSSGRTIYGIVGLLARMSRDLSGFFLHYKGKGMSGIGYTDNDDPEFQLRDLKDSREYYRPPRIFGQEGSYRYQRFTGEFDISELGKTASTDSIKWDTDEEQEFLKALEAFLKDPSFNLWAMAQNFQQRKASALELGKEPDAFTVEEGSNVAKVFFQGLHGERIDHAGDDEPAGERLLGLPLSLAAAESFQEVEPFQILDKLGHVHTFQMQAIQDPVYQLFDLVRDSDREYFYFVRVNLSHPALTRFEMGNADVRQAVMAMVYLMAIPEVFLPIRVSNSSFRVKINGLVDTLRSARPSESEDS